MGSSTVNVAMDNYSFETIELMRRIFDDRLQAARDVEACQGLLSQHCPSAPRLPTFAVQLRTCVVEIGFEAISDPATRKYFLGLGTNFHLPSKDVDAVIAVGGTLLRDDPGFKRLRRRSAPARNFSAARFQASGWSRLAKWLAGESTISVEPRIVLCITFMGPSDGSRSPPMSSTGALMLGSSDVMWSMASSARSELA